MGGSGEKSCLEAAEMLIWRRMFKVRWTCRKSNINVLKQEKRELLKVIEKRKIKLSGHFIRHNSVIVHNEEGKEGDVLSKRKGRCRQKA